MSSCKRSETSHVICNITCLLCLLNKRISILVDVGDPSETVMRVYETTRLHVRYESNLRT